MAFASDETGLEGVAGIACILAEWGCMTPRHYHFPLFVMPGAVDLQVCVEALEESEIKILEEYFALILNIERKFLVHNQMKILNDCVKRAQIGWRV
jgi:hypothetical protein